MFSQILTLIPRTDFKRIVKETGAEYRSRGLSSWSHFVDNNVWVASANFPHVYAHEIIKMVIDKFAGFHALGKLMSPGALAFGWPQEDIHPGALRAYKEAGIIK